MNAFSLSERVVTFARTFSSIYVTYTVTYIELSLQKGLNGTLKTFISNPGLQFVWGFLFRQDGSSQKRIPNEHTTTRTRAPCNSCLSQVTSLLTKDHYSPHLLIPLSAVENVERQVTENAVALGGITDTNINHLFSILLRFFRS